MINKNVRSFFKWYGRLFPFLLLSFSTLAFLEERYIAGSADLFLFWYFWNQALKEVRKEREKIVKEVMDS